MLSRYRRLWEWSACLLVVVASFIALQQLADGDRLSLALYDFVQRQDTSMPDPQVLIVAVDETSIQQLGMWPWPRRYHAELLRKLAEASPRVVGLDVIFSEPSAEPADDRALAAALLALRNVSPVYLPSSLSSPLFAGREPQELLPLEMLGRNASGLGHIQVAMDADGVARSIFLREGVEGRVRDAFSVELARAAEGLPLPAEPGTHSRYGWKRESPLLLPFFHAGGYRTVPFVSVLRGEVPPEVIRDKIVLVGVTAAGIGDRYVTPVSAGEALTSGVEVHATAVDALVNGRGIVPASREMRWTAALVALVGWMLCLAWLGPRASLLGLFVVVSGLLGLSAALQLCVGYWLPVGTWVLSALLGYLVWSWRRVTLLLADLYLRADKLPPPDVSRPSPARQDRWQHIVQAFDNSLEAMRKAADQRNDALQLLSHDLRSPQSVILALLRAAPTSTAQARELHDGIEKQVMRTLGLAEEFVAQLRAEGTAYDWEEVDLAEVAIEVYDRSWPAAQLKNQAIELSVPDQDSDADICWARIEPRLLRRALSNLVDNAVEYSPAGACIRLELNKLGGDTAAISVTDNGPGIHPDDLARLFERYRRGGAGEERVSGHGLGLWFVRTVAERHGGTVTCTSTPGRGCIFTVTLPMLASATRA